MLSVLTVIILGGLITILANIRTIAGQFFTTNYDNTIEDFWVKSRGYSLLDLGFELKDKETSNECREFYYQDAQS